MDNDITRFQLFPEDFMTCIIGFVSQKGGVGKSTLARLIGCEVAAGKLNVKIADLNDRQYTTFKWSQRRAQNKIKPHVRVEMFPNLKDALVEAGLFDVYILDAPGDSTRETVAIANVSDLLVVPTGQSVDDLEPSVILAHNLVKEGIPKDKIRFALFRVANSSAEIRAIRRYIKEAGYSAFDGYVDFRTGFSQALDAGRSLTETRFQSLNKRAERLAQNIIDAAASSAAIRQAQETPQLVNA